MKTKSQEKRSKKCGMTCTPGHACHCSSQISGKEGQKVALGLGYRVKLFLLKCLLIFKHSKRPSTVEYYAAEVIGHQRGDSILRVRRI